MQTEKLEIGKVYDVSHSRKGKFKILLTSQDDDWATGVITEGKTKTILVENEAEKGEEVTVRKSLATFKLG